jgi:hypothetical protein
MRWGAERGHARTAGRRGGDPSVPEFPFAESQPASQASVAVTGLDAGLPVGDDGLPNCVVVSANLPAGSRDLRGGSARLVLDDAGGGHRVNQRHGPVSATDGMRSTRWEANAVAPQATTKDASKKVGVGPWSEADVVVRGFLRRRRCVVRLRTCSRLRIAHSGQLSTRLAYAIAPGVIDTEGESGGANPQDPTLSQPTE